MNEWCLTDDAVDLSVASGVVFCSDADAPESAHANNNVQHSTLPLFLNDS